MTVLLQFLELLLQRRDPLLLLHEQRYHWFRAGRVDLENLLPRDLEACAHSLAFGRERRFLEPFFAGLNSYLSCILTSASLHDSQVAIPLATMTAQRVAILYDLMDSAYDAAEIRAHSESLGHVPIIDLNPRRDAELKRELKREAQARRNAGHVPAKQVRYRERSTVERVNSRVKDEFGARQVRVRGHAKVLCHLMFGIVALTVDQVLRLVN